MNQKLTDRINLLVRAGQRLISIQTDDEPSALAAIRELAEKQNSVLWEWSCTAGLVRSRPVAKSGQSPTITAGSAIKALGHLVQTEDQAIYVFKDIAPHASDPLVIRHLRDLADPGTQCRAAVILVDSAPLPDEVRRLTVELEMPRPDPAEIERLVKTSFQKVKNEIEAQPGGIKVEAHMTRREMDQLVSTLRGLSATDISKIIAASVLDDNRLSAEDLPKIVEAKRAMLGSSGCLETIETEITDVELAGLDRLRSWLEARNQAFSPKARAFGLEYPRGMLLLGIQGCGKSLCAKLVARQWNMPLLRLDPSSLYQKYVGATESRLRQALQQAQAMAPVVLWIDEIEKAFASAAATSADGGLSQRMFGTLLAWMQEHRHPIFLVATSNDISALPPELIRKGRFDEIFFVDLPGPIARKSILTTHLLKRKRQPENFDLEKLSNAMEGFSGAEIEQAVIAALYDAYAQNSELQNSHIMEASNRTQPLSVVMREKIESLRHWASQRCVPAE
ncbi:MAG: AAA family ATPase [bacterium]